jgi:4-carboxymuconolactone decarboxylase
MPASEKQQKGSEIRRQLMGEGFADRINQTVYNDPHMQKFRELTTETIFGTLWTRPGLDLKTRALICVVSDACGGRTPELGLHVRMALRQGWTEDELTETLLHLLGYVGAPLVREALLTATEVYKEVRAGR